MGSLEHRLKRLEDKAGIRRITAICSECGEAFVTDDDVWMDFFVLEWEEESGWEEPTDYKPWRTIPEVTRCMYAHEHEGDSAYFIEKHSGLPLFSREVSGMGMWDPIDRSQTPPQSHEDGG